MSSLHEYKYSSFVLVLEKKFIPECQLFKAITRLCRVPATIVNSRVDFLLSHLNKIADTFSCIPHCIPYYVKANTFEIKRFKTV